MLPYTVKIPSSFFFVCRKSHQITVFNFIILTHSHIIKLGIVGVNQIFFFMPNWCWKLNFSNGDKDSGRVEGHHADLELTRKVPLNHITNCFSWAVVFLRDNPKAKKLKRKKKEKKVKGFLAFLSQYPNFFILIYTFLSLTLSDCWRKARTPIFKPTSW